MEKGDLNFIYHVMFEIFKLSKNFVYLEDSKITKKLDEIRRILVQ